jgi:hypothetical protein
MRARMPDLTQFTEFRKDGWPLCPRCGEDELYSRYLPDPPALDEQPQDILLRLYLSTGVKCYRCQWESTELAKGTS